MERSLFSVLVMFALGLGIDIYYLRFIGVCDFNFIVHFLLIGRGFFVNIVFYGIWVA